VHGFGGGAHGFVGKHGFGGGAHGFVGKHGFGGYVGEVTFTEEDVVNCDWNMLGRYAPVAVITLGATCTLYALEVCNATVGVKIAVLVAEL
jgi:hypothetical protein